MKSNEFPTIDAGPNEGEEQKRHSIFMSRQSMMEWIRTYFNRSMLVYHLFYFFYYAAFGSLFPLISIYFKQLGMSAMQAGVLSGVRSFVECLATPFWSALAEKWKKGKAFLIGSLICAMAFTLSIGFVRPTPEGCLVRIPHEKVINRTADGHELLPLTVVEPYKAYQFIELKSVDMTRDLALKIKNKIGQSPLFLDTKKMREPPKDLLADASWGGERTSYRKISSYHDPLHYPPGTLVMPLYSTVVYSQTKINQIFVIVLLLVLFGEALSCPAVPLVDSLLGQKSESEQLNLYGRQQVFSSVGWSLAMFFIGIALDGSSNFPDYPCFSPGRRERNYMVCFATYSVFLAFSLFTSTQFSFRYEGGQESMYFKLVKDKMAKTLLGRTTKSRSKLVNEEEPETEDAEQMQTNGGITGQLPQPSNDEILEKQLGIKLQTGDTYKPEMSEPSVDTFQESYMTVAHLKITKWAQAMRQFAKPQLLVFLFVIWFIGLGAGQVFTFLFWHMQELGGSPTLFGIATVINHISEIVMNLFSKQIIEKIGHLKVLYLGLLANIARFLYVSWISNPWWILPFELLQGLTHAGVWVACCSYITQAFTPDLRSTTRGFLQVVHYGVGKGLGSIFGGLIIGTYGSANMFRAYGAASTVVLLFFLVLNYFMPIPEAEKEAEGTGDGGLDTSDAASYGQQTEAQSRPHVQFSAVNQVPEATHDYYAQYQQQQQAQQNYHQPY
ncbi:unnamed protein product [Calicophoron daubneyi]|uniref:Major facilitator superfamily (MFS) profile domain-containing protein n=1 Tax=Calicophoron daubneyi TaxID=300641 RepID=A0AAV2TTE4_CALDB